MMLLITQRSIIHPVCPAVLMTSFGCRLCRVHEARHGVDPAWHPLV
jgi:hypothetical protein